MKLNWKNIQNPNFHLNKDELTALKSLNKNGGRCLNLKNGKEASKDTEESPAGCAGEGK